MDDEHEIAGSCRQSFASIAMKMLVLARSIHKSFEGLQQVAAFG
jgi:hypothetical protein